MPESQQQEVTSSSQSMPPDSADEGFGELSPFERSSVAFGAMIPVYPLFATIVDSTRRRHDIVPPRDQFELAYNLKTLPVEDLLPEVEQQLRQVKWPRDLWVLNYLLRPDRLRRWARWLPGIGSLLTLASHAIESSHGPDKILHALASLLARYAVVGNMEPPPPFPLDSLVKFIPWPFCGDYLLVMVTHRGANPHAVAEQLVNEWDELYGGPDTPHRFAVPPTLPRQAWVWATYKALLAEKTAERDRDASLIDRLMELLGESRQETSRYVMIADMYCEVFPGPEQGEPDTKERDAYIEKLVPDLRKWCSRFEEFGRKEYHRWLRYYGKDAPRDR